MGIPHRMCRSWRLPTLGLGLAGLAGCSGFTPVRMDLPADTSFTLVWPAEPEIPRIRFLRDIGGADELGVSRSLLSRVQGLFTGRGGEQRLGQPYGIALDSAGRIYVADQATSSLHVLDPGGGRHREFSGTDRTEFQLPVGVALDAAGRIFVSDSRGGFVVAMDGEGKQLFKITEHLVRPAGLAVNPSDGLLYVVDVARHQVLAFDISSGVLHHSLGGRGTGPGEFNFPTNITIAPDGTLYVSDALNFRVQGFDSNGANVLQFGRLGDRYGQFARPKGVAVDSEGHVYVVEGLYDAINVFDREGRLLLTFGGPGSGPGEFWLATGLFIDRFDRIFVADSFNGRIQVFQYIAEDAS